MTLGEFVTRIIFYFPIVLFGSTTKNAELSVSSEPIYVKNMTTGLLWYCWEPKNILNTIS